MELSTQIEELLSKFEHIANSPEEQMKKYKDSGKQVVLCAPIYTPEEIVHSMGLIPMGAWGGDVQIDNAKNYFPTFICGIMQSILELGTQGVFDEASAIIIPAFCDSMKCLGENWKYAVPKIPFIPMSYPQNRKPDYATSYTMTSYKRVVKDLEQYTGEKYSDDSLSKSIEVYNEHNALMREISDVLVDHPQVKARQRNSIFKSAYFMEKGEHNSMLKELILLLAKLPVEKSNARRVVVSGILADNKNFLEIFEDNNLQIVADDVANESRQYRTDAPYDEDPIKSLALKFRDMDNCSVLYDVEKKRAKFITDLVKKHKADGVIVALTKFCDPEEFDYPILKKEFDEQEIPSLLIEIDRQMVNYEQARTNIQTFKEIIEIY